MLIQFEKYSGVLSEILHLNDHFRLLIDILKANNY